MDQLCFVNDFPGNEEEKFYKVVGHDSTGNYSIFTGGTYVWIKNRKGLTVRFTGPEIKGGDLRSEQIEAWVKRLRQLHEHF